MSKSKSRPVGFFAVLLLCSILATASLSAFGVFDPPSAGSLLWHDKPGFLQIHARTSNALWLDDMPAPDLPATIRISAAADSGETDIAYGLVLGQKDGAVAIAVSPLGNVAVWKQISQEPPRPAEFYLPWQTWPHVRSGGQTNEIEVNLDKDIVNVRINHEWLWEGNGIERVDRIGVFGISYGDQAAISFQSAELLGN